jgi:hypothetical protein
MQIINYKYFDTAPTGKINGPAKCKLGKVSGNSKSLLHNLI